MRYQNIFPFLNLNADYEDKDRGAHEEEEAIFNGYHYYYYSGYEPSYTYNIRI